MMETVLSLSGGHENLGIKTKCSVGKHIYCILKKSLRILNNFKVFLHLDFPSFRIACTPDKAHEEHVGLYSSYFKSARKLLVSQNARINFLNYTFTDADTILIQGDPDRSGHDEQQHVDRGSMQWFQRHMIYSPETNATLDYLIIHTTCTIYKSSPQENSSLCTRRSFFITPDSSFLLLPSPCCLLPHRALTAYLPCSLGGLGPPSPPSPS